MSAATLKKRSKVKPFVKIVNYHHLLPTRYSFDLDTKHVQDVIKKPSKRRGAVHKLKTDLVKKFKEAKHAWFFSKLRF